MNKYFFVLMGGLLVQAVFAQRPITMEELMSEEWHVRGPELYTNSEAGCFAHKEEEDFVTTWGPSGSYHATIEITRYYGSASERARQVKNRLMPEYARLVVPAGDCDDHALCKNCNPQVDRVYLNGHYLGMLTGDNNSWVMNSFMVPIEHLRFPSSPGEVGKNELEIIVDCANDEPTWYLDQYCQAIEIPGPTPIFLVHGWSPAGTKALTDLQQLIRSQWGIPSELGSAPMDNSPDTNAVSLAKQLAEFCQSYGVKKFNVVAHSKGGLDSRAMIDRNFANSPHAKRLLQIATPNAGSYLADMLIENEKLAAKLARRHIPEYRPETDGMRSLTRAACAAFNESHNSPRAPISTVIGRVRNSIFWDYYLLGKYSYGHDFDSPSWEHQGDGIVSVPSAHALGTQLAASPLVAEDSRYAHDRIVKSSGALGVLRQFKGFLCEVNFAVDSSIQEEEARAPSYLAPLAEISSWEIVGDSGSEVITNLESTSYNIISKTVAVEANDFAEIRFSLDASPSECSFLAMKIPRDFTMRLTCPDGTSSTVEPLPEMDGDEFWSYMSLREAVVTNTQEGIYTIRLTNPSEVAAAVTVACRHPGAAATLLLKVEENGWPPRVVASLLHDGKVVVSDGLPLRCGWRPATPEGELSEAVEIPLRYSGDGRYVADLPMSAEGKYLLSASWLDSLGEVALGQEQSYYFSAAKGELRPVTDCGTKIHAGDSVHAGDSAVSDEFSDSLPQEFSALATALRFEIDAVVAQKGNYALSGKLFASSGKEIASASHRLAAEAAGPLHFTLDFDGEEIYDSKCDGPYLLKELKLIYLCDGCSHKTLATLPEWSSAAFRHQEFRHSPLSFLGIDREWLERYEVSENESQTLLHILFSVLAAPGYEDYDTFGATIFTPDGQPIRSFSAPGVRFSQDENGTVFQTELVVDTGELLMSGSAGPFRLDGFFGNRQDGQRCILFGGSAQTKEYQPEQFDYHATTILLPFPLETITCTPTADDSKLFDVEVSFTRKDAFETVFRPGAPLLPPYRIAVPDYPGFPGLHLVDGTADCLNSVVYEWRDFTGEILRQLHEQGNHDDFFDDGEAIRVAFQLHSDTGELPPFSPCCLLARLPAPLNATFLSSWHPKCIVTDLDQNQVISSDEAERARKLWEKGEIPRHLMLQTLEFSKYDGYHYEAEKHDFMPGRD